MAGRYGNTYQVLIQADKTFNVQPDSLAAGWVALPDKFEITNEAPEMIPIGAKDQSIIPYNHTKVAGLKKPVVHLSGELTDTHEILLKALTGIAATPYILTGATANVNTVNSYTIAQQFTGGAGGDANLVTGCVLETLTLRGDAGGPVMYDATFRAGTVTREDSDTYSAMSVPTLKPFLSQNMGGINLVAASIAALNSWELTFTRTFPDDKFMFQNSQVWTSAGQCAINGSFKASYTYDITKDASVHSVLGSSTMGTDTFYLADDTAASGYEKWTFVMYGMLTEYTLPDPDRCVFEASFSRDLLYDGSNNPISIAIATVAAS